MIYMDVCIARKPVFDKNMNIFGYDLLYSENNLPDADAEAQLLYDSFFVIGIDDLTSGASAFIRYSSLLITGDIPISYPKDKIVVEILENDFQHNVSLEDCSKLKALGYTLALDDFVLNNANMRLLKIADVINIDFSAATLHAQAAMIDTFKGNVRFLAKNIETRDDYKCASELGYDLFEGNFFTKPSFVTSKEVDSLDMNLYNLIQELDRAEPDYGVITEIIERDLGLSYKLLKFVNSAAVSSGYKLVSISRAVTYLGTRRLRQFLTVIMVKKLQTNENAELIRLSLVRGKLMSLLAVELGLAEAASAYFFTGIFSLIDVILNNDMQDIIHDLPLISDVKQALLGELNDLKKLLDFIILLENENWENIGETYPMNLIDKNKVTSLSIQALKWANILD